MTDLRLTGCSPEPLANYLKALGVLRLVAEQADPAAKGWWDGDTFVLRTGLDRDALIAFFAERLSPTPIVGPWAGGCGFFPKDNHAGIDAIRVSTSARFADYRETILAAQGVLVRLGLDTKPDKEDKGPLIEALRAALPDKGVQWIDSALALTDEGPRFPPLLGTGGNDGRLDFTNNLMQRWSELLLADPKPPQAWLLSALFGGPASDLPRDIKIGQFHPAGNGGANLSAGFDGDSLVNPWNFVLMLEGALLFASAVTRRLESARPGALVYPFTVRATGGGYASADLSDEDDSRNEIWLPQWSRPTSLVELRALFSEGRARVRSGGTHRAADTAVDFARAIQELGVQRGVATFTRFGFHKRNGLSFLAVPLGRWEVRRNEAVDLLAPLDTWLHQFRRGATGKNPPASVRRALSRVEGAVFDLCATNSPGNLQTVLVALGAAEGALARSMKFTKEAFLRPVRGVTPDWLDRADDRSVEWRLAVSLASAGLRDHLVPVRHGQWADTDDGRTVWGEGDLVSNLIAVARRRAVDAERGVESPDALRFVDPADIAAFIDGAVDDQRLTELLQGASLVYWKDASASTLSAPPGGTPPYVFLACALAWHARVPVSSNARDDVTLPRSPAVLARLVAGDVSGAVATAHRRLHGSGLSPRAGLGTRVTESPARARRIAAALLFPLSHAHRRAIADEVVVSTEPAHLEST